MRLVHFSQSAVDPVVDFIGYRIAEDFGVLHPRVSEQVCIHIIDLMQNIALAENCGVHDAQRGNVKRLSGLPFEAAPFGKTSLIIEDDHQGTTLPYPSRDGVLGDFGQVVNVEETSIAELSQLLVEQNA